MVKRKWTIVCIICLLVVLGCIIGGVFSQNKEKNKQTSLLLNYYSGNYYSENREIIKNLNDNKIDRKFMGDFEKANTPEAESIVVGDWIAFYDNCLEQLYSQIVDFVNSSEYENLLIDSSGDSVDSKDISNLKMATSKYAKMRSTFFEKFQTSTLGHGTETSAYLGLYELNEKRMLLFEMIELTHNFISFTFFDD